MGALLDRLFGPRDFAVVEDAGYYLATHKNRLIEGDRVIQSDLREGAAQRFARRLRQQAEDRPEPLL